MAQTPDGTPYVEGSDFVSGWPSVSKALADQIDALRRMQPVGMITPYAGELNSADDLAAIDGWLPCDGKAYKRADFPDLYTRMSPWQVQSGFPPDTPNGSPNTSNFYVPDLRGRSPIGIGGGGIAREWQLGERWGDYRTGWHLHDIQYNRETTGNVGPSDGGTTNFGVAVTAGMSGNAFRASGATAGAAEGVAGNYSPATGVNFLVWTGTTTIGKSPISGVEIAPITTRMMIEARLEEADITEDDIAMLRDQLAALKDGGE